MIRSFLTLGFLIAIPVVVSGQSPAPKAYRLPSVDLKERVIWGANCEPGGGVTGLAFGGQDQDSADGRPHTRLLSGGKWQPIHEKLQKDNPLREGHGKLQALARKQKDLTARARALYFAGKPAADEARLIKESIVPAQTRLAADIDDLASRLKSRKGLDAYQTTQVGFACERLRGAREIVTRLDKPLDGQVIHEMWRVQVDLEVAAEALDAEPPPRALSPLAYDAKSKLFILFGGEHCDYLTNDTWVFDPATKRWQQRHPVSAPPPRANHSLKAAGDGKVTLSGGYTYTSNTDYIGGQYRDHQDGDWVYDVAADKWSGSGKAISADKRTYRSGPFHPDFYLQGPKPDAAAFQKKLASLPVNTWVMTAPPQLPQLNRDWGTAVLDPDRDLILRWSGGHSAHGGTDVLHFHRAAGRWELCFPVEFPLGQLYSNTSYPAGFNFNLRPWITGHTYQSYGYDQHARKMIFVGRTRHSYFYDPDLGDWLGRKPKPPGMVYNSCFYTLTLCSSPHGLYCWTQEGRLFHYNAEAEKWQECKLDGKLPGSSVDNSTMVHDSKRDRLLTFRKSYGKEQKYSGSIHAVDLKTLKVSELPVKNKPAAAVVPYLCQIRYDAEHDCLLVGGTFDEDGTRRTPAYDCGKDEWISFKLTGSDPNGKQGRNVSLGMMYDASRKLFWAVDTSSRVYVLKLDPKEADSRPLR